MAQCRILIVEDEAVIGVHLQACLCDLGYQPNWIVATGEEALHTAEKEKPDLILMDIVLKGELDGIEAAREIRRRFNIPVIYCTAYGDQETIERATPTEPRGYLLKPFRPEELRGTIETALYRHRMEERAREAEKLLAESRASFNSIVERSPDGIMVLDGHGAVLYENKAATDLYGCLKGHQQFRVSDVQELIGRSMDMRRSIPGLEEQFVELSVEPTIWNAETAYLVVARVVTAQKRAELSVHRNNRLLKAINRVLNESWVCETVEEIGRVCLSIAEEMTGSKFGWMGEVNKAGSVDTFALSDPGWELCSIPKSESVKLIQNLEIRGIWATVLKTGHSQIINNPAGHPDSVGLPEGHPVITSFVGIPLKRAGSTFGLVALGNKVGGYNSPDVEDMEILADIFVEAVDRKKGQIALATSDRRYRRLFQESRDGVYMTTVDGRILEANQAFLDMFGYSGEELLSASDSEGINVIRLYSDPDDRLKFQQEMEKHGSVQDYPMRLLRKDGAAIECIFSSTLRRGEKGTIIGYQGTVRDITEKRKTESLLAETLDFNQRVIDASPLGIVTHGPDGQCVSCNESATRIIGCTREQLLAQNFRHLDSWRMSGLLNDAEEVLATGVEKTRTVKLFTSFGKGVWVQYWLSRFIVNDEFHLLGVFQDVTTIRLSMETQRRLATAIQQAAESVIVTDRDGRIHYVNPAFRNLTGYTFDEVLGKTPGFLGKEEDEDQRTNIKTIVRGGEVWAGRVIWRTKDSRDVLLDLSVSPVRDSSGQIMNFVGVAHDVTQQVELQQRLAQAQKMEAIGTLASGIAHDFNNILFIMLGYTEMARAALPVESRQATQLRRVLDAGRRAADMVKQILAFSRKSQSEKGPFGLAPIVKEALKFLRGSLPATIQIQQTIDPELPDVLANPTQVHQVLMNLCANAAHAMKNKQGVLSVVLASAQLDDHFTALHQPLIPGKYVQLTVADTGSGIPADMIDRIFDPYFTTKAPDEGTGLGLSVVDRIVKDHGGTITVQSELNKGTTFTIFLPAIKEKEDAQQEVPTGHLPLGSERILLVDDEPDIATMARDLLGGLGYQVESMTSPVEALKLFQSSPNGFDLVLTDLTMPRMTGNDLAAELIKIRPDTPIILCTGWNDEFATDFTNTELFRAVLRKPISKHDLAHTVHRVLHPTPSAVLS